MKHFLIIGRGLSAFVLAHHLDQLNFKFTILGKSGLSNSSLIAAGIWNPVVMQTLSKSWKVDEFLPYLKGFYQQVEKTLNCELIGQRTIIRPFKEQQEIDFWIKKASGEMKEYLEEKIYQSDPEIGEFKFNGSRFGKIKNAGVLNIPVFIQASEVHFQNVIVDEVFDHGRLIQKTNSVEYKKNSYEGIVFCEGHLVHKNPFFNYLPLKPVKGELLEFECDALHLKSSIVSKGKFIMRAANRYKIGSTFDWKFTNEEPESAKRTELENDLSKFIIPQHRITHHLAGIRPSVTDRRPLIGSHPEFPNLYVFNGFGSKGVLLSPFLANNFVNFLAKKEDILEETDVKRFNQYYWKT